MNSLLIVVDVISAILAILFFAGSFTISDKKTKIVSYIVSSLLAFIFLVILLSLIIK